MRRGQSGVISVGRGAQRGQTRNRDEVVFKWGPNRDYSDPVIFKRVGDVRPYPDHGYVQKQWAAIAPHQVRLDQLVTTKRTLDLEALLEEDSTFYGDLFAHVVSWRGEFYLEDGLHRALRAALQQRQTMHARVLDLK